jgi:hypothetical protein
VDDLDVVTSIEPTIGTVVGVIVDDGAVVVIGGGRRIGVVMAPSDARLRDCLAKGWRFHGEVIASGGNRVTVRIFGAR